MAPPFFLQSASPGSYALAAQVGQAVAVNSALYVLARITKQRMLTAAGVVHALGLGILLWSSLSWQGYTLCIGFLIFGSFITKVGRAEKEALGIAEKRGGARGPENIWGSAGVAAICALLALMCTLATGATGNVLYEGWRRILLVGYTASLATKISDTTASEIGKAYGSFTYLVTTFRVVPKGTEGAVSLEGTVAGALASIVAAFYALGVGLVSGWLDVGIVALAAFVATTAESVIGATVQEQYGWTNEFVNFVNTVIGAAVGISLKAISLAIY